MTSRFLAFALSAVVGAFAWQAPHASATGPEPEEGPAASHAQVADATVREADGSDAAPDPTASASAEAGTAGPRHAPTTSPPAGAGPPESPAQPPPAPESAAPAAGAVPPPDELPPAAESRASPAPSELNAASVDGSAAPAEPQPASPLDDGRAAPGAVPYPGESAEPAPGVATGVAEVEASTAGPGPSSPSEEPEPPSGADATAPPPDDRPDVAGDLLLEDSQTVRATVLAEAPPAPSLAPVPAVPPAPPPAAGAPMGGIPPPLPAPAGQEWRFADVLQSLDRARPATGPPAGGSQPSSSLAVVAAAAGQASALTGVLAVAGRAVHRARTAYERATAARPDEPARSRGAPSPPPIAPDPLSVGASGAASAGGQSAPNRAYLLMPPSGFVCSTLMTLLLALTLSRRARVLASLLERPG